LCVKEAVNGPQTPLQGKAGCLITVMGDWVQLHTIATLLKLAKHCHRLFRAMKKLSGKAHLTIYSVLLWCLDTVLIQIFEGRNIWLFS